MFKIESHRWQSFYDLDEAGQGETEKLVSKMT
jgi:hypothetical protein